MTTPIELSVGLTNFTNYLLIVVRDVANPSVEVDRQSFGPAPTLQNVVFNLEPQTYYFDYRDSPDGIALGSLRATYLTDGKRFQIVFEERYYTCGGPNPADPVDGATFIVDSYLSGKDIASVFKEGGLGRPLDPADEYVRETVTDFQDKLQLLNGTSFSVGEKLVVGIKYKSALPITTNNNVTAGVRTITAAETLTSADYNYRLRLASATTALTVTLPVISSVPERTVFYFVDGGGNHKQAAIKTQGADRIFWPQFAIPQLSMIGCSRGQFVQIEVTTISGTKYYEVTAVSNGVAEVGQHLMPDIIHANMLADDNGLIDGAVYPWLSYWVNNVLPATQRFTDPAITGGGYTRPTTGSNANKPGHFIIHGTLDQFRMPDARGLYPAVMADFTGIPGLFADQQLLAHGHDIESSNSSLSNNDAATVARASTGGTVNTKGSAATPGNPNKTIKLAGGATNEVKRLFYLSTHKI